MTKITNDKLFGPDFLGPQKQSMQELIDLTVKLQTEMKQLLQTQKATLKGEDTKTTEGLKKRKQAITLVNAVSKEMVRLEKQRLSLTAQVVSATSDEAKHVKRLQVAKQQLNKTTKQEAILNSKLTTEYQKQSTKLIILRAKYKDLILTEGQFSTKTREVGNEVRLLDTKLKAVDGAAGQFQRNVGNYPNTLAKAGAALRRFGLAFGGVAIFRNALGTVTDFDEGLADIAKTTGLSVDAARELSLELGKIDTRSSITELQQLATSAGRLGIEGKENILGFVRAADQAFVALGDDLGGTADEIATNLGKVSNLFGLEGEFGVEEGILKVGSGLNELAANSKAAAGPISDFTNRMAGLADIVAVGDVQALGALFDESGQSMEIASSTLNKLLPAIGADIETFSKIARLPAEEFKKIADTAPIEALKLVAKGAKSSEGGLSGLSKTLENFGIKSARSANVVNVLANETERLTELQAIANDAINEGTSLTEEFDIKNDTLGATIAKLKNKWDQFIISIFDSTGAFVGLKTAIAFVGDNLGTILKVVKNMTIAWLSYRIALKLVNRETTKTVGLAIVAKFKSLGKAIKNATRNANGLKGAFQSMGKAIGRIPLAAFIAGIVTAISVISDLVTGTESLTDEQEALNDKIREEIELRKQQTEARRSDLGSITDRVGAINKLSKEGVGTLASDIETQISTLQGEMDQIVGTLDKFEKKTVFSEGASQSVIKLKDGTDAIVDNVTLGADGFFKMNTSIQETAKEQEVLNETQSESKEELEDQLTLLEDQLKIVKGFVPPPIVDPDTPKNTARALTELQKLQKVLKDLNTERANELILRGKTALFIAKTNEARAKDKEIKDILEKLKLTSKLTDNREREIALIQAEIDAQRELATVLNDKTSIESFGQAKAKNARDLAVETARINIEFNKQELASIFKRRGAGEILAKDTERINQLKLETLQLEQQIRDTVLDDRLEKIRISEQNAIISFNQKRIDGKFKTNEELIAAEEALQQELLKLRIKGLIAQRQFVKDGTIEAAELDRQIIESQVELENSIEDSNKRIADKEKDFFNQRLRATQEFAEQIRQIEERRINRQIEGIDREIEESQRREDMLTALAVNGNQTATESISAEIRKQEDLQRRKDALEKKKARQKALVDSLGLLEQKIENDEVDPVTSTIRDMTKLFAVISTAIPGFYKGTKTTVKDALGGPQLSGRDGYIVRVDGSEKVLNPELSRKTGNMTTDEIVDRAVMHKMGVHDDHQFIEPIIREIHQPFQSPQAMLHKLDSIEKAINNKEVYLGGEFINNYEYWQERIKAGNKTIKNLHKTDSING